MTLKPGERLYLTGLSTDKYYQISSSSAFLNTSDSKTLDTVSTNEGIIIKKKFEGIDAIIAIPSEKGVISIDASEFQLTGFSTDLTVMPVNFSSEENTECNVVSNGKESIIHIMHKLDLTEEKYRNKDLSKIIFDSNFAVVGKGASIAIYWPILVMDGKISEYNGEGLYSTNSIVDLSTTKELYILETAKYTGIPTDIVYESFLAFPLYPKLNTPVKITDDSYYYFYFSHSNSNSKECIFECTSLSKKSRIYSPWSVAMDNGFWRYKCFAEYIDSETRTKSFYLGNIEEDFTVVGRFFSGDEFILKEIEEYQKPIIWNYKLNLSTLTVSFENAGTYALIIDYGDSNDYDTKSIKVSSTSTSTSIHGFCYFENRLGQGNINGKGNEYTSTLYKQGRILWMTVKVDKPGEITFTLNKVN